MGMYCHLHTISQPDLERYQQAPEDAEQLMMSGAVGLSLEKSWHGLHFVLTGTVWEGEFPLNFLLLGGEPLDDVDTGYGPPRLLTAGQVIQVANALDAISDEEFDRRFQVEQMNDEQVYPTIWDEPRPDLLSEYLHYFTELKDFVRSAAQQRMGLMIYLG